MHEITKNMLLSRHKTIKSCTWQHLPHLTPGCSGPLRGNPGAGRSELSTARHRRAHRAGPALIDPPDPGHDQSRPIVAHLCNPGGRDRSVDFCGWWRNKNGALPAGSRTAARPEVGIEPTTPALQKRSSTIELPWHPVRQINCLCPFGQGPQRRGRAPRAGHRTRVADTTGPCDVLE